jgi:hypothetical protein
MVTAEGRVQKRKPAASENLAGRNRKVLSAVWPAGINGPADARQARVQ